MDTYIKTIGHYITKFNSNLYMMLEIMFKIGQTNNDLLTNLFKHTQCDMAMFWLGMSKGGKRRLEGQSNDGGRNRLLKPEGQGNV